MTDLEKCLALMKKQRVLTATNFDPYVDFTFYWQTDPTETFSENEFVEDEVIKDLIQIRDLVNANGWNQIINLPTYRE